MAGDVRYALRTFARAPAFAVGTITILALGIAVNTIAFSVLNALAFRPLPVPFADRVVRVYPLEDNGRRGNLFSYPDVNDYRAQATGPFETLAAYVPAEVTVGRASLDGAAVAPRPALAYVVSPSYFDITGVSPARGRVFGPVDEAAGARTVVLSHGYWQHRLNADPSVIGATIVVNAQPFTIVGVAQPGFAGTEPLVADMWMCATAMAIGESDIRGAGRDVRKFLMLGRLRRGVAAARAQAALDVIAARLAASYPATDRPRAVEVASGTFFTLDPGARPVVAATLTIVGLVLLIACGNVANLVLARALSRRREIAVRLAIGASRLRIIRQLLVEALLLSVAAGGAALLISTWTLRILYARGVAMSPFWWTVALTLEPDVRVFVYTLGIATIAGGVFGLFPALQMVSPDIVRSINGGRALEGRVAGTRLRHVLVVTQIAGSLVLLAGAGLFMRGLQRAEALDLGLTTRGVIYAEFNLEAQRYSPARAAAFTHALLQRLVTLPGVEHAALTSHVPLHGGVRRTTVRLPGSPGIAPVMVSTSAVSPGYFEVLGIAVVAGRPLADADAGSPALVISDGLARRFWPGDTALGKALASSDWPATRTVVGVVRDAANTAIWREKELAVYLPLDGTADPRQVTAALVRTSGDSSATRAALESVVATLDPDLGVAASPLDQLLRLWILPSKIAAASASVLAALALALASFGLYAVLSFAVSQRLREIGIRLALGATSRDVARLVLTDTWRLVGAGLIAGGAGVALGAPVLERFLFGVSPFDPVTMAGVCLVLAVVALSASYLPARRATRLPPLSVLRVE